MTASSRPPWPWLAVVLAVGAVTTIGFSPDAAWAVETDRFELTLSGSGPNEVAAAVKMMLILTGISLAPLLLLTMSSFVRIIIVLSFLRTAMGTQGSPPQQVLLALALFLTAAVMAPTAERVYGDGIAPYLDGEKSAATAFADGSVPLRSFMIRQTRDRDLALFFEVTQTAVPKHPDDVPLHLLAPAFVISELRTAFEMGFTLFIPFLVIDLVVASILMSLGMMMLPPALVSLPIKLMLLVLSDGWNLLVGALVRSFA